MMVRRDYDDDDDLHEAVVEHREKQDKESLDVRPDHGTSLDDVAGDITIVGDAHDTYQLNAAKKELERTEIGAILANEVRENDVTVGFRELEAAAQYDHTNREIAIREEYRDADPTVLAAHLAHEGTHAQWYGQGLTDSIDQEYHAFKNQKEVWDSIKGDRTDEQCDWVSAFMEQDEADVKMLLLSRPAYRNLPEYS